MADVTEVLNKAENKEELKAVLPLSAKQESEIFQQITTELTQQNDFEAFLSRNLYAKVMQGRKSNVISKPTSD